MKRVAHNFNAGPSGLPKAVLKKVRNDLIDYKGLGISVAEMSHRQREFQDIAASLETNFRNVMKIPSNF